MVCAPGPWLLLLGLHFQFTLHQFLVGVWTSSINPHPQKANSDGVLLLIKVYSMCPYHVSNRSKPGYTTAGALN